MLTRIACEIPGCIHRYPVSLHEEVLAQVRARFALDGEAAILTRGVDEAVDLILHRYPNREPVVLRPEFTGYIERFVAARRAFRTIDFALDVGFPASRVVELGARNLFFVSSPHNPSGDEFEPSVMRAVADGGCIVLLDRAYRDFADAPAAHEAVHPHMFRFYSFSKAYGLAGQRVGVLVGSAATIRTLGSRQWYCHMDAFTLLLLAAAMSIDWKSHEVRRVVAMRRRYIESLGAEGFVIRPSQANFLLVREPRSEALIEHLFAAGIRVASTVPLGLDKHVRITIGTSEELAALLTALDAWPRTSG